MSKMQKNISLQREVSSMTRYRERPRCRAAINFLLKKHNCTIAQLLDHCCLIGKHRNQYLLMVEEEKQKHREGKYNDR